MVDDPIYMPCGDEAEQAETPESEPSKRLSPAFLVSAAPALSEMSISALAEYCKREISHYRNGETSDEQYGLELLRRAILCDDQEAWASLQHCLSRVLLKWLRHHPNSEAACRLDSEENYIAQTFERFWLATAHNKKLEFHSLSAALQYLHTSLNGVIVDALRASSRSKVVPVPEPGTPGEPLVEDTIDSGELWELLREMIPNEREQRLIYLFFYCGLKPREIVRYCPQEFSDVHEVYHLRRNIMQRLLRDVDHLRWRLGTERD